MFYFVFEGKFQLQAPPAGGGGYFRRADLTEGFFCVTILGGLYLEGLIHRAAYFRNFTVITCNNREKEWENANLLLIKKQGFDRNSRRGTLNLRHWRVAGKILPVTVLDPSAVDAKSPYFL